MPIHVVEDQAEASPVASPLSVCVAAGQYVVEAGIGALDRRHRSVDRLPHVNTFRKLHQWSSNAIPGTYNTPLAR